MSLQDVVERFPTMERFQRPTVLPVTPIPRVLPDSGGIGIAPTEANLPFTQTGQHRDVWFNRVRATLFGDSVQKNEYSVGDIVAHTVRDVPEIEVGRVKKEGVDVYVVYGELTPRDDPMMRTALYQAAFARSVVNACVLSAIEEPSEDIVEYLEKDVRLNPLDTIREQVGAGEPFVPVFADRQSAVDASMPKTLNPASSAALLLFQAADQANIQQALNASGQLEAYEMLFEAMPPTHKQTYASMVALLRDDQFDGYEDEFRAPGPDREDILPSDPLYALVHLNDALYRQK
ncbi:MAG: hypothetical protein CMP20_01610 [Rickettsiales bacterium]|nr:hypothetical protein [Rickettsiales bacterium]